METEIEHGGARRGRPTLAESASRSSLSRAEQRAREIRGMATDGGNSRDKFWAPEAPDGWSYEWKRRTIYNKEDPSYSMELVRQGWEPVPLSRHPEMMPRGWQGETIEVEGLLLMERPKVFCDESRARERAETKAQIREKEAQLTGAPRARFGTGDAKVRKTYEPMAIPTDE